MSNDPLVRMANDIGRFFGAEPQRADAVAGVAGHIERFWDPRMRRKIAAYVQGGGTGLDELVAEAVSRLPRLPPSAHDRDLRPGKDGPKDEIGPR